MLFRSENWYFNPSGTGLGGATQVNQYLDFIGTSYVQNYSDAAMTTPLAPLSPLGTNFFFKDNGAFNVLSHDSSGLLPIVTTGGEVTSLYSGGTGAGILGGGLTFNAGGTLAFFSQAVANFGSTTGIYGANDGTPIGSFTQISGCQDCFVNPTGLPTGAFAIFFEADTLAPGYWFNPDGSPMAAGSVLGFATFNGTYTTNPTANQTNEIAQQLAGAGAAYTNIAPTDFILGNNGRPFHV